MSTFFSLNVHVVFSTKNREPHIMPTWRERFHAYMGGCLKPMGTSPLAIGGTYDHVHLLIGIKPSANLSDTIRELKKASTKWVHDEIRMGRSGGRKVMARFLSAREIWKPWPNISKGKRSIIAPGPSARNSKRC